MLLANDTANSLQHWPSPMSRFGQNAYGENLYRIIFAPSRRFIVYGTWPDGSVKATFAQLYRRLGNIWVMEQWRSAEQFTRCSKEVWNRDYLCLGPWPERGEYEICHPFETSAPDDANLEKLISWIQAGQNVSLYESQVFQREDAAREKKAIGDLQEDMIRDRFAAYGTKPFVGARTKRGTKTRPILRTAQELGLPTQGGQMRTKPNPHAPKFAIPLEI